MEPLVSIITPSFNQVRYLEQALRSVLEQGYPRLEYIVIDGGSTDGSLEVLKRYEGGLADWSSEPDRGQVDAINKGLRRARGEIVAWLNSDDAYLPGAIAEAVQTLRRDPALGMVYADGLMVDSELKLLDRHVYPQLGLPELLCFEVILQPTVFMRRRVVEEVGYLNSEYRLILDHELWVRIASCYPIRHVSRFWSIERTHPEAKTIAQAAGFVEEAERLIHWASQDPTLAPVVERHRRRVHSGLDLFAARRLIDAGEYREAVRRLWKASVLHPPTVGRYWFKVVQAVGSALGLASAFEGYRRTRRRFVHRGQVVDLKSTDLAEEPGRLRET
ncbi:MAG TPA: glycosyltransferase family 2 protein [Anaerolineales bacterium]|nr:glycosyltransferase family 2 protein [Anaerolineales bacterium]